MWNILHSKNQCCPAENSTCFLCGVKGHFAYQCLKQPVHSIEVIKDEKANSEEEIIPSMKHVEPELQTKRCFIPCSKSLPVKNCGINVDELAKNLNQKNMYFLLEDQTMSPNINKGNNTPPSVKQCSWSPIISHHKLRSLLGILTNWGALEIYDLWRNNTNPQASLSDVWFEHCKSQWGDVPKDANETLMELRARSHKIKITCFSWGECTKFGHYDLLAGTLDGTIIFWRICQHLMPKCVQISLISSYDIKTKHITSITPYYLGDNKYLVFLAFQDGTISNCLFLYSENDTTHVEQQNELWTEADRIVVHPGGFHCIKDSKNSEENSELVLYAVKGNIVLIFYINNDGKLVSMGKKPIFFNDLFISGFAPIDCNEFLIVTNSGKLHHLVNKCKEERIMEIHDSLIRSNYSCYGLCLSKNSAIAAVATSVRCSYDHLTVKDTGHIIWFSLYDTNHLNDLVSENKGPMSNISDVFEALRIDLLFNYIEIPWNYTSEEIDKLETANLKNLLMYLKLSMLSDTVKKKNSPEKREKEAEIKDLILSCHVFKTLSCLINRENLDDLNEMSLVIMREWLNYLLEKYSSQYHHTTTTAAAIQEQLSQFDYIFDKKEKCTICGGGMKIIVRSDLAECESGHHLPRCSLSLLQCTDFPYYTCKRCDIVAHPNAVTDTNNCCLFCDDVLKVVEELFEDEEIALLKKDTE